MSHNASSKPDESPQDAADRTSERRSFFLNTVLSMDGAEGVHARVRNLSAGGMMIELEQAPEPEWAPGDRVSAELRNIGLVKGEIAWAGGRRYGVKFDRELDPELARKPVSVGKELTPDYLKPILVPNRSLGRITQALKGR
jgi:hypothetical protein